MHINECCRSLKCPLKWSHFFVWTLGTPGIKTPSSWCIINALIAFPVAFNEGERLLFKSFCSPGVPLDAIWFYGLDAPALDLLALMCSLDLMFFSTGNWYLFCALLVYYRWNIAKFFLTERSKWKGNAFQSGRGITLIKAVTEIILTSAINLLILRAD